MYAHWTANKYTVTFVKNDGTSNNAGTNTVTFDSTYGTLPIASRSGYIFQGWFTAASGGTKISNTTKVTTASNHNLYAQWKSNPPPAPDPCQCYGRYTCCNCYSCM